MSTYYTFSVEHAEKYGLNEAIMLHNFIYWLNINRANNHNYIDGRHWTYNSAKAFQNLFPFWTQKQIQYLLSKMVDYGILLQGCFNKDKRDRTSWYTLSDEFFSDCILQNREMDTTKSGNDILQNREMIYITDKKQQIKNTNENNINTASGFSQSENSVVNDSFTTQNPTVKESLTVQKPKKEIEITKKDDIESFVRNFKATEFEVDGVIQFQSIFSENEIELITGYLLKRKEKHKSKAKSSHQAIKAILNKILEIKGTHALEVVFEQYDDCYVNCGTAGDPTTPWIRLELEYFTKLIKKPTFNNQYAKSKLSTTSQVAEMFKMQKQYTENNEQINNEEYECPF